MFLTTIQSAEESYGLVSAIRSPKGLLPDVKAELPDDLAQLVTEGPDDLLHVEAGGVWWHFGGLV